MFSTHTMIFIYYQQINLKQFDVLSQVKKVHLFSDELIIENKRQTRKTQIDMFSSMISGEPLFEKEHQNNSYRQYHRHKHDDEQKQTDFSSSESKETSKKLSQENIRTNTQQAYPSHSKRRAKRQQDFDPMAKHVEVLVAYDYSIKEFHSDADIKSYILTLFSYVRFLICFRFNYFFS